MPFDLVFSREALVAALLTSLFSVVVLIGLLFYLNHYTRKDHFTIWAVAWLFYGLWLVMRMAVPPELNQGWNRIAGQCSLGTSAVFLLWGSLVFMGWTTPQRPMALFLAFIYTWSYATTTVLDDTPWGRLPVFLLMASASLAAAIGFYRLRLRQNSVGATLLAAGFALWSLYLAAHPLAQISEKLLIGGVFFSGGLQLFIGASMIILMLEEARLSAAKLLQEIQNVQLEKETLRIKIVSDESRFRNVFGELALRGNLQAAYEELRRTQQTVVQQERLRALGQMASGMAHDINNSLTPIIGFSDFLLDPDSGLPDQWKKHLQCIRTAAGDIAHIVEQVRQFYRRRHDSEIQEALDLNRLAREVIDMTRPRWQDISQREGVTLKVETDLDEGLLRIQGNASELREALTNLVFNAVDAMPSGGSVTLATRCLAAEGSPAGLARVALEVRDTGVGMDELTRQRCLEPFFSTKGPRGSGLGLAMVYGMMRRHEGEIEIESELGKGTTVRLAFPATPDLAVAPAVAPTTPLLPLRILCVDDDRRIGAMLLEVLQAQHHTVEIADGGAKGLEAFRKAKERGEPFQVVITDLGMPNVDGREIVRTVKAESPDTPVIMLTGWAAMLDEEGQLPAQVDAVVSKPPKLEVLQNVLSQLTLGKAHAA